jgi:hypothetical protein
MYLYLYSKKIKVEETGLYNVLFGDKVTKV